MGNITNAPQSGIEELMGFVAKVLTNTGKTMGNQFAPLGAVADFMTEGPASLLEDMSWGGSALKPGGHGPNIDSRVMEFPGPGSAMKAAKLAFLPALGAMIRKAPMDENTARAMLGNKLGKSDDEIWDATKVFTRDPGGKPLVEVPHNTDEYASFDELGARWRNSTDPEEMNTLTDLMMGSSKYADRVKNSALAREFPDQVDRVTISNSLPDSGPSGMYRRDNPSPGEAPGFDRIFTKKDLWEADTIGHETQHVASKLDDLTRGASKGGMQQEIKSRLLIRRKKIIDNATGGTNGPLMFSSKEKFEIDQINSLLEDIKSPSNALVRKAYRQSADEVRARFYGTRDDLNQKQMHDDPFFKKLGDIDEHLQIDPKTNVIQNPDLIEKWIDDSMLKFSQPASGRIMSTYRNPKYAK